MYLLCSSDNWPCRADSLKIVEDSLARLQEQKTADSLKIASELKKAKVNPDVNPVSKDSSTVAPAVGKGKKKTPASDKKAVPAKKTGP